MMDNYRYLNTELNRPLFLLSGLAWTPDGALTLARVPQLEALLIDLISSSSDLAGISADQDGNLYIADPSNHRILRRDACDGSVAPLPCFGGEGTLPGQLKNPRGVLVAENRLYVADTDNHRIQVIGLPSLQLIAVWGHPHPYDIDPASGSTPDRLNTPTELAVDSSQNIYVLDTGNHRVLKFSPSGQSEVLTSALVAPQHMTVVLIDGHERLLVLDFPPRVLVFGLDGSPDTALTDAWAALLPAEIQPVGIAVIENVLYLGDKNTGRIRTFDHEGSFIGVVRGYQGTIAGLSVDHKGQLLIHGGGAIVRVTPGAAYAERGSFLAGPFSLRSDDTRWYQLRIEADTLPPAAHFQFYTLTSMNNTPPAFPTSGSASAAISTYDEWRAAPVDAPDMLLLHVPARYFWVAGSLQGDGTGSPTLRQMRLTFDHEGWVQNLPAIYQEKRSESPTLERILGLFESVMSDAEQFITDMALLLDPLTAEPAWLEWLAGWFDFELDETWTETQRRQALSEAFRLYSQRGTPHGLERLIELYTGVTARIEEPTRYASVWSLGETSTLGFTTMLAAANVQGAVVGTSAMLTDSHLITEEEYGVPLFEDIAHDFCVLVYAPPDLTRVHQILEREKPAHTRYHLCVIDAALRVGQQARIGIDTIIGGQPNTLPLDGQAALGMESTLPPEERVVGRGMKLT